MGLFGKKEQPVLTEETAKALIDALDRHRAAMFNALDSHAKIMWSLTDALSVNSATVRGRTMSVKRVNIGFGPSSLASETSSDRGRSG